MAFGGKRAIIIGATSFYRIGNWLSVRKRRLKNDRVWKQTHESQNCYGLAEEPFGNWLILSRIIL
jgi:hypothetical protein